MKPRATAALAFATLLLAAFVWFYEIRGEAGRISAAEAGRRVFPGLVAAEISSLSLEPPGADPVRAERSGSGWRLVQPLAAPGDAAALDAMTASLARMQSQGVLAEPGPVSIYGLDETALVVGFRAGSDERRLRIGRETPLAGAVYALAGSLQDGKVQMIATTDAAVFDRTGDDLRDRRLLDFSPRDVDRISIARADRESGGAGFAAELERRERGFEIVAPVRLEADATAVERLLDDLALLRADSFVDGPDPEVDAALLLPDTRIVLAGDALARPVELALGPPPVAGRDGLRVARGRDGRRYRVSAALVAHLPDRLFALRAKQLARFDPDAARALQLDFASGESLRFERTAAESGWSAARGAPRSAALETLLETLSRLAAADVVAESLGSRERAALGLEPAELRVRVFGAPLPEGPALLADLGIASGDARGRLASAGASEVIYRLDPAQDSALSPSYAVLENALLDSRAAEQPLEQHGGAASDAPAP